MDVQRVRVTGLCAVAGKSYRAMLALSPARLASLRSKDGELENWRREPFLRADAAPRTVAIAFFRATHRPRFVDEPEKPGLSLIFKALAPRHR